MQRYLDTIRSLRNIFSIFSRFLIGNYKFLVFRQFSIISLEFFCLTFVLLVQPLPLFIIFTLDMQSREMRPDFSGCIKLQKLARQILISGQIVCIILFDRLYVYRSRVAEMEHGNLQIFNDILIFLHRKFSFSPSSLINNNSM